MNIGRKLTIALDWDNVLAPCTELACQKMTQRGTPVSVEDVTLYSFANFHKELADVLMAIFKEPDFFDSQVLYPGAAEMVEELLAAGHEVVIASAMPPEQMGIRGKQICSLLPGIKESNVMLGSRKDLLHVDFLLDDADYNITSSPAKYPVLFTRPWNKSMEGFLRAAQAGEPSPPALAALVWETLRWPLLALLLGFTALGLLALPLLFAVRGFLLAFSIASFVRLFGGTGCLLALLVFGVGGAFSVPALFVLGVQSFMTARTLAGRVWGESKAAPLYGRAYWLRCGGCAAALCVCMLLDGFAVPALVSGLAGTLLAG